MNAVSIDDKGRVTGVAINKEFEVHAMDDSYGFDKSDNSPHDDGLSLAEPLSETPNVLLGTLRTSPSLPKASIQNFLQSVPHLFTLTAEQVAGLKVMVREYSAMNVIIDEGLLPQHVYVLASGTVEVMNSKRGLKRAFGHRRIGSITAPNVFGMDDALLDRPSEFTYHASTDATLLLIPKRQIIDLFALSPIFANNVSSHILQTLPAFSIFQEFCRAIFGLSSASLEGGVCESIDDSHRLALASIINIYKSTGTLLHRYADRSELDAEALRYSVQRLPTNITETYILHLTNTLPDYVTNGFLADAAVRARGGFAATTVPVDTGKRRRCAWKMGAGGQTLVVMRDGFTDTIDFISTLAMFVLEARKLRARLQQLVSPSAMEILFSVLSQGQDARPDYAALLAQLTFTPCEADALIQAWGDNVVTELYNILVQREEYVVQLQASSIQRFAQDVYAIWSLTIMRTIRASLGVDENDELPSDLVIDVLFSPNRTLKNLFCGMLQEFRTFVDDPAITSALDGKAPAAAWKNEEDRYYYILAQLLERDETVRNAYRARLECNGFTLLEDAHSSALLVDCIDVSKICVDDVDSSLRGSAQQARVHSQSVRRHFIVNVDKTFGAQIEATLRALLLTFGDRIRSVNLMGKAAGLVGNRGDVVLPSKLIFSKQSFGEDSTDEIRLCNRNALVEDDIAPFLGKSSSSSVHDGACLTLPGFVMQSESVLKFYKIVHGCAAVDMQSSYVARQLEECRRTGVLCRPIQSRYLFYCDDMPLGNDDGSALKPRKREIISTIYATARSLLRKVLQVDA